MRYLYALNTVGEPDWVAMEEVPDVLPLWKQYASVLRRWGFSVWYGILNAAILLSPQQAVHDVQHESVAAVDLRGGGGYLRPSITWILEV